MNKFIGNLQARSLTGHGNGATDPQPEDVGGGDGPPAPTKPK